jgi:P4 family phage/plasmid primase-like protien
MTGGASVSVDPPALRVAQAALAIGWSVIPVPPRSKNPNRGGWQKERHAEGELPRVFAQPDLNCGLLLGSPSGDVVDVDLDTPAAAQLGARWLPPTGAVYGRTSAPASHRLYVPTAGLRMEKFLDPTASAGGTGGPLGKATLVELRSTGGHSLLPGSVHPSGEPYRWEAGGPPEGIPGAASVDADALPHLVRRVAAGALLAALWTAGRRHFLALDVAGVLLSSGWRLDAAAEFLCAVALVAGDPEHAERRVDVETTAQRRATGQPVTGIPELARKLGSKVVDDLKDWLGVAGAAAQAVQGVPVTAAPASAAPPPPPQPGPAPAATPAAPPPTPRRPRAPGGAQTLASGEVVYELAGRLLAGHHFALEAEDGSALYVYEGGVYRRGGERFVRAWVIQELDDAGLRHHWTPDLWKGVAEHLRAQAPVLWARPPDDTLNLKNGLLRLALGPTGAIARLEPHSPRHLAAVQLPVDFDPQADCPATERFYAQVLEPDVFLAGVHWEVYASVAVPMARLQECVLFLGEGSNGKSRAIAALRAFVGRHNTRSLSLKRLEHDRFAVAGLVNKVANLCPDLPTATVTETAVFKALTVGDTLTGERKFEPDFDFDPFCRLVFSANNLPAARDASEGYLRRYLILSFPHAFPRKGKGWRRPEELDAELSSHAEQSGVLNRVVSVWERLRRDGFTSTPSMEEAASGFREAVDPLAAWLDRSVREDPAGFVPKSDLWRAYNEDCRRGRRPVVTEKAFSMRLKQLRPALAEGQRTMPGPGGVKARPPCWLGLNWRGAAGLSGVGGSP